MSNETLDLMEAWRAIGNALEEHLRHPGQRAYTPEDLHVTVHDAGSGLYIWSYRGALGTYQNDTREVEEILVTQGVAHPYQTVSKGMLDHKEKP